MMTVREFMLWLLWLPWLVLVLIGHLILPRWIYFLILNLPFLILILFLIPELILILYHTLTRTSSTPRPHPDWVASQILGRSHPDPTLTCMVTSYTPARPH